MNELISVNYENDKPMVNGRDLRSALQLNSNFIQLGLIECVNMDLQKVQIIVFAFQIWKAKIVKEMAAYCRVHSIKMRSAEINDDGFGVVNSFPLTAWNAYLECGES